MHRPPALRTGELRGGYVAAKQFGELAQLGGGQGLAAVVAEQVHDIAAQEPQALDVHGLLHPGPHRRARQGAVQQGRHAVEHGLADVRQRGAGRLARGPIAQQAQQRGGEVREIPRHAALLAAKRALAHWVRPGFVTACGGLGRAQAGVVEV